MTMNHFSVFTANCISSKGHKYSAIFALEEKNGYVNLKLEEFIGDKKAKDTPD